MEKHDKEYLEMCQKAEEIQRIWKPRVGDWVIDIQSDSICIICSVRGDNPDYFYLVGTDADNPNDFYQQHVSKVYWLPTQSQLQEMLGIADDIKPALLEEITQLRYKYNYESSSGDVNLNGKKLWFVFYMWKKHRKLWDTERQYWEREMFDEALKEKIRNALSYWDEDESLLLNDGVEAVINVFKEWIKENRGVILKWLDERRLTND